MDQGILMLLIFGDRVDFPSPGTQFMITEDGRYMDLENGSTRMVTESL